MLGIVQCTLLTMSIFIGAYGLFCSLARIQWYRTEGYYKYLTTLVKIDSSSSAVRPPL